MWFVSNIVEALLRRWLQDYLSDLHFHSNSITFGCKLVTLERKEVGVVGAVELCQLGGYILLLG